MFFEALGLFHVNFGDHIRVEEGDYYIHLLYLLVVVSGKSKDDAKRCIAESGCEHGVPVHLLHVSSSDETSFVFDDGPGLIPFEFELP